MRVIYYLPDIDAGVSRIVINLLRFRPRTMEIKYAVVLIRRNDLKEKAISENINADEVIRFNYRQEENAFSVLRRLRKTIKNDSDVIVGNDGLEIKMVATQRLKNPVVYIVHGDFPSYYSMIRQYYPVINCIITYSNKTEKTVKEIPGVDTSTVHKIYYPSDIQPADVYAGQKKKAPFKIVFAGLLIERKGADLLPAIYASLMEHGMSNFQLEVIGEGELFPGLKSAFCTAPNVVLSGWQNQQYVRNAMAEADVFLFPSRLEGLPNVLVEALASGAVPVVTNLESGVSDMIVNEVNGLLVEKDDVKMFAGSIIKLYKNHDLLARLRANAGISLKMFDPQQQAKAYDDLTGKTARSVNRQDRVFPAYKRGRVLDRPWLPGWFVFLVRSIIRSPKL